LNHVNQDFVFFFFLFPFPFSFHLTRIHQDQPHIPLLHGSCLRILISQLSFVFPFRASPGITAMPFFLSCSIRSSFFFSPLSFEFGAENQECIAYDPIIFAIIFPIHMPFPPRCMTLSPSGSRLHTIARLLANQQSRRTIILPCFQLLSVLHTSGKCLTQFPEGPRCSLSKLWRSIKEGVEPPSGDEPEREIEG
jgi:hypothetical protein